MLPQMRYSLVSPDVPLFLLSVVLVKLFNRALRSSDGVLSPEFRGLLAFLNLRLLLFAPFPDWYHVQRPRTIIEARQRT